MALALRGTRLAGVRLFPQQRVAAAWFCSAAEGAKGKLVVFGGSGFLGKEICKTALAAGFDVVSVSRSIPSKSAAGDWVDKVDWISCDVFDHDVWVPELKARNPNAAVSAVGGIRESQRNSEYYNGDSNMTIFEHAPQFKTFVYLGTQQYGFPASDWLRGYYRGKAQAEAALFEKYPQTGASLQLVPVYGEGQQAPLTTLLQNYKSLSEAVFPKSLRPFIPSLCPPLAKEEVARAVVRAVQINLGQLKGQAPVSGKVEYDQIQALSKL